MSGTNTGTEMVTMTAAQAAALREGNKLLDQLGDDPDIGMTVKRGVKKYRPDARIPEIDVGDKLLAPLNDKIAAQDVAMAAIRQELDDRKAADAAAQAQGKIANDIAAAARRYGLTTEGQQAVLERMAKNGTSDAMDAAAGYLADLPKPKPTSGPGYLPQKLDFFGSSGKSDDERVKQLHNDPQGFFDDTVVEILNDPQYQQAA